MERLEDERGRELGLRLAHREASALEDAYSAYGPAVLAYLSRYVGRDEAEDLLQRTFLDVWSNAARYDPHRRFTSWLFTIAHHRAVDALRARHHQVLDLDTIRDLTGEDGRETADRFADAADVRAAVARLPGHEREVIEMAYFEDLTQRQIADRLDLPLGTVKARASRGTRRLAGLMGAPEGTLR